MKKKETKKEEVFYNIRMDKELRVKYTKFCKDKGFAMAKRIRVLIEEDIKNDGK